MGRTMESVKSPAFCERVRVRREGWAWEEGKTQQVKAVGRRVGQRGGGAPACVLEPNCVPPPPLCCQRESCQ